MRGWIPRIVVVTPLMRCCLCIYLLNARMIKCLQEQTCEPKDVRHERTGGRDPPPAQWGL